MHTDFENAFHKEPVTFLLSNALRHLTQDQQRELCNALQERLPVADSIEEEAKRLYPYGEKNIILSTATYNSIMDVQREAHITAARQYMDTIDKLRAENVALVKLSEEIRGTKPIENLPALVGDELAQKIYALLKMADSTLKQ